MLREKSEIKLDPIGVTLMGLSSLHDGYGPSNYWYILVVIETTPTCLDLGDRVTWRYVATVLVYKCTHGNSIPVTMIYCMLQWSK